MGLSNIIAIVTLSATLHNADSNGYIKHKGHTLQCSAGTTEAVIVITNITKSAVNCCRNR
jgi:hypothetical protein